MCNELSLIAFDFVSLVSETVAFMQSYHSSVFRRASNDPSVILNSTIVAGRAFLLLDQFWVTGNSLDRIFLSRLHVQPR